MATVGSRSAGVIALALCVLEGGCSSRPAVAPCPAGSAACTVCVGMSPCTTGCYDITSSNVNCGGCGTACAADRTCRDGECVCLEGTAECGTGVCADLASAANCGACGVRCAPTEALCVRGACTPCGLTGQSCCESGTCRDGVCDPGGCSACGGAGERCCDANACDAGLSCTAAGICGTCGGFGEACCIDGGCERPVVNACDVDGRCWSRACAAVAGGGFGPSWPTRDHCSYETGMCTQSGSNPVGCVRRDTTPPSDGFDCADCVLYAWLSCSVSHGCADLAADVVCCMQANCDPAANWPCAACDDAVNTLVSCNDNRDPSFFYCNRFYSGGAISQCF